MLWDTNDSHCDSASNDSDMSSDFSATQRETHAMEAPQRQQIAPGCSTIGSRQKVRGLPERNDGA